MSGVDSYWTLRRGIKREVSLALQDFEHSVSSDTGIDDDFQQECSTSRPTELSVENVEFGDGSGSSIFLPVHAEPVPVEHDSDISDGGNVIDFDCDFDFVCDDHDSEPSEPDSTECLRDSLVDWVLQYDVPRNAVGGLLKLLNPHHPELPLDERTLMRTPRSHAVCTLAGGGEYIHFGVQKGLESLIGSGDIASDSGKLELQFNVDGLPLFKSSNLSMWPILCIVRNSQCKKTLIVGCYCGESKPANVQAYFERFVNELQHILSVGFDYMNEHFDVVIHSFVCDAPARAMVKNIKGHSGYSACEKCHVEGEWQQKVTFQDTNAALRTDAEFADMTDSDHHLGRSAVQTLPVGTVSQFPLDYMHMACLGVMRRLLLCWLKGPLSVRLGTARTNRISDKLTSLIPFIPREFGRKPRSLNDIMRWKATEFRQFLLYTGPVVLKHILPDLLYQHFLLFSVAMTLLISPRLCAQFCGYAKQLLVVFVENMKTLYGKEMIVYNVHSLIHLPDDACKFGPLDSFSCFPFETALNKIKRLLRKPSFPLQQLANRLAEQNLRTAQTHTQQHEFTAKKEHSLGPLPAEFRNARQYEQLHCSDFYLSVLSGDNCVTLSSGSVCVVRNILVHGSSVLLVVEVLENCSSFYEYPLPSAQVNIVHVPRLHGMQKTVPVGEVVYKNVCLPAVNDSYVVFPFLHSAM